jgi:hypothetical protein
MFDHTVARKKTSVADLGTGGLFSTGVRHGAEKISMFQKKGM